MCSFYNVATLVTNIITLFVELLTHIKSNKCETMNIKFTNTFSILTNNIFN